MGCTGANPPCFEKLAHGAAGLAKAGLQLVGFSIDRAPDQARRDRLDVCRGCDRATRNQKLADRPSKGLTRKSLCIECGCLITAKTMLASEQCPLQLWPAVAPERRGKHDPAPPPPPFEDVGVVAITAFQRPLALARLHASVRERWPSVPVLIADNGNRYAEINDPLTTYDRLEFDCGLSAARNHLIDRFLAGGREFMALFEEDVVCSEKTDLAACLDVLGHDPEIGWVGMPLRDPHTGLYWQHAGDMRGFREQLVIEEASRPWLRTQAGTPYRLCDLTLNVGVGRREFFTDHRWREELKLAEHWDFFDLVRRAGKWKVAFVPVAEADHDRQIEREGEYKKARNRAVDWQADADRAGGYVGRRVDEALHRQRPRPSMPEGPSEAGRVVIILGQGRSGSTLLSRLLNAAPGVRICGENDGAWEKLQAFAAGIEKARRRSVDDTDFGRVAWSAPDGAGELADRCRRMLLSLYNPNVLYRVWGFKEIRHGQDFDDLCGFIDFVRELFPAARFILNVRDAEQCLKSRLETGWWDEPADVQRRQIEASGENFTRYAAAHPDHALLVRYEDLARGNPVVAGVFGFAGIDYRPEFEQPLDVVLGASSGGD
jgi:hypothetical protein